jgi:hypothetical protein
MRCELKTEFNLAYHMAQAFNCGQMLAAKKNGQKQLTGLNFALK